MAQVKYTACWLASVIVLNACTPGNGPQPYPSGLSDSTMLNVAYGPDPMQRMDVYLPEDRNTNTKVIVLIHGGAWSGGDKSDMTFIQPMIAEKWPEAAVVNINYRLANGASITHKEISSDLKQAMDYISGHHVHWQVSA
ncbi:MAG: carboxylesterase family protein, partial [Taibaiella sp.]|nr:carboxylesterase family protein [Taibaiella sp.]